MISKVKSCGLAGIDGFIIDVEVDLSSGLPAFDIVGLPDTGVKESRERVKSAIKNCGYEMPIKRIIANLAPADIKKEGSVYDLPIAVALLILSEQCKCDDIEDYMFCGELSLDGAIRRINGALPMTITAKNNGIKNIVLPSVNAKEAAVVDGINVIAADDLHCVIKHLNGTEPLEPVTVDLDELFGQQDIFDFDFADVKGQESVKRAIEVAVAGGHNILMIGSPGSGKSMIAKRIPGILPNLTFEEALETTKIHSIAGVLPDNVSIMVKRPYRSPHHSVSSVSLVGGGVIPKPGEISLAHNGVLFLDELPEFTRQSLEVMRQPLEDGNVTVSRINATYTYPTNVLFVASMNPCKCGYYGDLKHRCTCSPNDISRYVGKISGPLLDRIDIHIEVPAVDYESLQSDRRGESSAEIKKRINAARNIQLERFKNDGIYSNSQMTTSMIKEHCKLSNDAAEMLRTAFDSLGLSARAYDRILKVARTVADLDGAPQIQFNHIAEAIQYRSLDRKYWMQ